MSAARLLMAINPNQTSDYAHKFGKKNQVFIRGYSCNNASPICMRFRTSCSIKLTTDQLDSTRRSGMYKPNLWGFDRIQSLNSVYTEEKYSTRACDLIMQVKKLLEEESNWLRQLQLIDDLQRLGLSYRFDVEIDKILNTIYLEEKFCEKEMDLYSTSLAFRLLRQHGLKVSQDVFDCFKNEDGDFEARFGDEMNGILELYEASFLLIEGEDTLEVARLFTTKILQKKLDDERDELLVTNDYLRSLIRHSLDLPLHWRAQRPSARWFIDAYATRSDMNPIMLELAKLDFNIVQATHQQEVKQVYRWWNESRLAEKLPFARDRVVENYLWNTGMLFEPQYGFARIMNTKLFILITVLDDVYDVYGTPEEIHLFTNIITRWDIEAIDQLPEYMQICYMAIDNIISEMSYEVLKEHGVLIIQDLRKSWADLCKMYAIEAEWYYSGYKPTLKEYIKVAWVSISAHLILCYMFFLTSNLIEKEASQSANNYHNIIRCSAMILRLANDLGTSSYEMQRGDVPKAVECYMNENGSTREEAREYVQHMLREMWKETNGEKFKESPFTPSYMRIAADLGRMAQYMYQHGDGHGIRNPQIEDRVLGLIFNPIV